jgi:hypothetical protein
MQVRELMESRYPSRRNISIAHHNLVRVKKHGFQHDVVGALGNRIEFERETSSAPLCS